MTEKSKSLKFYYYLGVRSHTIVGFAASPGGVIKTKSERNFSEPAQTLRQAVEVKKPTYVIIRRALIFVSRVSEREKQNAGYSQIY